ncbi:uncharacterized protein LY89DRAFT_708670 [Mollisia scopiformis]|uniref:N-acetyltransferase domain-containing protein n=1 Tax=Mollisia scopiformis TaxID=149040 RepID=A0A194X343_MOLSC|nr:uncharacterized protein LY89DRAFT_708670 [Mollisia scopiformis]KUJ14247.1 hypothetical protein LY89DRAFT_708670 [Mollisia scopiformis]
MSRRGRMRIVCLCAEGVQWWPQMYSDAVFLEVDFGSKLFASATLHELEALLSSAHSSRYVIQILRSTMGLKLEVCGDADMTRTFAIMSEAFGHEHPYIDAAFPEHDTPAGRASGGNRMLAIKHADPNTTFLKVTDIDTGLMIAQAKWNIYKNTIPPELDLDGDFWENDEEKEYAQLLCREYLIPRRRAIKASGGNLLSLDLLTVDPQYQRRGAGRLLVKWGTALADELGFMAVVEATEQGRGLYESEGFKAIDHWQTRLPEKWAGRGKQGFLWMVRPAKKL